MISGDINQTGAEFYVICKRCNKKIKVTRNWGGGIRRDDLPVTSSYHNPAVCNCGSRNFEIY